MGRPGERLGMPDRPIGTIRDFNEQLEDFDDAAEEGGIPAAARISLYAQQITVLASREMRQRDGLAFLAAKSIQQLSQSIGDLGRGLR